MTLIAIFLTDELRATYIHVSNDTEDDLSNPRLDGCDFIGNEDDDVIVKQCDEGLVGRYIGLRKRHIHKNKLKLCEMVVIGYRYGGNGYVVIIESLLILLDYKH